MLRRPVDFACKCEFFIQPASPAVSCPPAVASVRCPHWPHHSPCFLKPLRVLLMPTAYATNLSHLPSHRLRILLQSSRTATHLLPAPLHPPSSYPIPIGPAMPHALAHLNTRSPWPPRTPTPLSPDVSSHRSLSSSLVAASHTHFNPPSTHFAPCPPQDADRVAGMLPSSLLGGGTGGAVGSTVGNAVGTPTPAMPTSACRHPLKKIPASGVEGGSFGGSGGGELEREDSREALLLTHFAVQSNLTLSDLTSPGVVKGGLDLAATVAMRSRLAAAAAMAMESENAVTPNPRGVKGKKSKGKTSHGNGGGGGGSGSGGGGGGSGGGGNASLLLPFVSPPGKAGIASLAGMAAKSGLCRPSTLSISPGPSGFGSGYGGAESRVRADSQEEGSTLLARSSSFGSSGTGSGEEGDHSSGYEERETVRVRCFFRTA